MLNTLLQHFLPFSLSRSGTLFSELSQIDRELAGLPHTDAAANRLELTKPRLYARLRENFPVSAAQALTLRILNIFLARFHLRARSTSLLSRPIGLVVDPSNMCRLACPGCVHSSRSEALALFDWPKATLSAGCFAELMRRYGPHAIGVYFCNYGEPLLNRSTPDLIRTAKQYMLSTALSTSLSVARFDAEAYVESGLDFMVVSIDGATQPVYERFRRHGTLELVLENLRRLVDVKRKLGRRTPVLSWNFIAFEHNAHEIPLAARMAHNLGVNLFRVVSPFDVTWDDPEIRPASVKPGVRRLDLASFANLPENWNPFPDNVAVADIARSFENPWGERPAATDPATTGTPCHWLYKNLVMDAAGRVLPCCGAPRRDAGAVFTTIDAGPGSPFDSPRHREARAHTNPYCNGCEWDQTTVNIGSPEIRRYFRAADPSLFDRGSVALLSDW